MDPFERLKAELVPPGSRWCHKHGMAHPLNRDHWYTRKGVLSYMCRCGDDGVPTPHRSDSTAPVPHEITKTRREIALSKLNVWMGAEEGWRPHQDPTKSKVVVNFKGWSAEQKRDWWIKRRAIAVMVLRGRSYEAAVTAAKTMTTDQLWQVGEAAAKLRQRPV